MQEPLILLHGDDRFLVTTAATTLRDQLCRDLSSDLGLEEFRDSQDIDAVERSLASPPFLAFRRVVLIWDPPQAAARSPRDLDRLLAAVSRRAETTATVVVLRTGASPASPLAKGVRQLGGEVRLVPRPKGRDLRRHLDERIKARGLNLATPLVPVLMDIAAQDLGRLEMELDKLALFPDRPGERVDEAQGRLLVSAVPPQELYRLTDALFDSPAKVGAQLQGLLSRPEVQPPLVLGAMARALRDLISFADPKDAGRWRSAPSWKAERLARQLGRVGEQRVREWLVRLADLDWRIRSGAVDATEGLETLLAGLAGQVAALRA